MFTYRSSHHRLSYDVRGSGPPLVLLHGLSGSRLWWRKNIPALAQHFTVYTVDLIGYGRSNFQLPLSFDESADLLERWMVSLELSAVNVIGHSMGGQTAVHWVARYPQRVQKLVLAASSGMVKAKLLEVAFKLGEGSLHGRRRFLPTVAFDALRASPQNLYRSARAILDDDFRPLLLWVACPTLLIWGAGDVVVTRQMGEAHRLIADSHLEVIAGAGHNLMYDKPLEFNALVLEFLLERKVAKS